MSGLMSISSQPHFSFGKRSDAVLFDFHHPILGLAGCFWMSFLGFSVSSVFYNTADVNTKPLEDVAHSI
jgi:hypothetical protein